VAIKKSATTAGPVKWTVAEFGAFYTEHRSELLAHANRVLKDSAKAEEITQDALIKFMLAAPELESSEHALSYLHRTIENLCIDVFRLEGRRPNLVVLDDATAEIEASWAVDGDHSAGISAAEDAAIIRQALALLSPAERAAIVMWEMEGRSTQEIAAELGIKESAVRHTLSRARASLRRILTELVIDEERGLTALDLLSTTYKKAADLAQKSSKVALSLILVVTAFLGFNSLTGNEGTNLVQTTQVAPSTAPSNSATPAPSSSPSVAVEPEPTAVSTVAVDRASLRIQLASVVRQLDAAKESAGNIRVSITGQGWAGLDASGTPIGFTSNTGAGTSAVASKITSVSDKDTVFIAEQMGVLAYISQNIEITNGEPVLQISPIFSMGEDLVEVSISSQSVVVTPGANGSKLVNVWLTFANSGATKALPTQLNVRISVAETGSILSESAQFLYTDINQTEQASI